MFINEIWFLLLKVDDIGSERLFGNLFRHIIVVVIGFLSVLFRPAFRSFSFLDHFGLSFDLFVV